MSLEKLAAVRVRVTNTLKCVQRELDSEAERLARFVERAGGEAFSTRTKTSIDLEALKRRIDSIKERVDGLAKEVESGLDLVAQLSNEPPKEAAKGEPDPDERVEELECKF